MLKFFKNTATITNTVTLDSEIPNIFPLGIKSNDFIRSDIVTTFRKILIDTFERTHGIKEEEQKFLWDTCLMSDGATGLVSFLSQAMYDKSDLFLVLKNDVLRKADQKEEREIRDDYAKNAKSSVGIYVSFKRYDIVDMLKIYSALEYCVLGSLNKSVNLSNAIQIKIAKLRESVANADAAISIAQAKSIAQALGNGNDVLVDVLDAIETGKVDISPTEKAIQFLDAKRAWLLGVPLSYVAGELSDGMNSTGEGDVIATERGLKQFFFSITKPVSEALFGITVTFRSENTRQLNAAMEGLKSLDLVSDELLPRFAKQNIVFELFNLDAEEMRKILEEEAKVREANRPDFGDTSTTPKEDGEAADAAQTEEEDDEE